MKSVFSRAFISAVTFAPFRDSTSPSDARRTAATFSSPPFSSSCSTSDGSIFALALELD
jgi:hypothetical protein